MYSKALILGALQIRDMTGYEIRKLCTEGSFSYFSELSYGTIYPMLSRLENEGLVNSTVEEQSGKPDKKVFSISDKGKTAYCEALETMLAPDVLKSEFCLLALSAELVSPRHMERAIEVRKQYYRQTMLMISELANERKEGKPCPDCHDWLSAYGEHIAQAHLSFLEEHGDRLVSQCGMKTRNAEPA